MKYAFIAEQSNAFSIVKMCCWLGVSRSGYYRWRSRTPSRRSRQREEVRIAVLEVYQAYKKRYGAPRITEELKDLIVSAAARSECGGRAPEKPAGGKTFGRPREK